MSPVLGLPPIGPKPATTVYVTGAAFSPDAGRVVVGYGLHEGSGNSDAVRHGRVTLAMWDVETGRNRWAAGTAEDLVPIAFRADGHEILVHAFHNSRGTGVLQLWDADTGQLLRMLTPDPLSMTCVALSSDGGTVAAGDDRGRLHIWDIVSGRLRRTITGRPMPAATIRLSPDGLLVLCGYGRVGGSASEADLWEAQTGRLLLTMPSPTPSRAQLAISPAGSLAVGPGLDPATGQNILRLSEVATGREVRRWDVRADAASFTSDGKQVAVENSLDGRLIVLDVASGEKVWTIDRDRWQYVDAQ